MEEGAQLPPALADAKLTTLQPQAWLTRINQPQPPPGFYQMLPLVKLEPAGCFGLLGCKYMYYIFRNGPPYLTPCKSSNFVSGRPECCDPYMYVQLFSAWACSEVGASTDWVVPVGPPPNPEDDAGPANLGAFLRQALQRDLGEQEQEGSTEGDDEDAEEGATAMDLQQPPMPVLDPAALVGQVGRGLGVPAMSKEDERAWAQATLASLGLIRQPPGLPLVAPTPAVPQVPAPPPAAGSAPGMTMQQWNAMQAPSRGVQAGPLVCFQIHPRPPAPTEGVAAQGAATPSGKLLSRALKRL